MMPAVCLRAVLILICPLFPHLGCGIGSLDARDAPPVDPYAFDYDHNSQTNKYSDEEIQRRVESNCAKQVEEACIKCSEETRRNCGNESWELPNPGEPHPPEKDQKICDSVLFRHLIKRISKVFTEEQTKQVVISLEDYSIGKLQKYLSDESGDVIPGADIVDMLASSLTAGSSTDHIPYTSSWFERTFSLSFNKVVVGLVILFSFGCIFKLLLTGNLSFIRVICALLVTVLFISFAWSYMLLYQKKISERMADDAQRKEYEEVCNPQKNLTAFQKVKAFIGFSLQKDERCQKFMESYQIDPFLEVHPIEAITDTFERIITSLSGALGKGLGNFNQDYFTSVSPVYWIPGMVFNLLLITVILGVYLYCGRRRTIVREVRDNQVLQGYGRDNNRIEEAHRPRIEAGIEPALQPPPERQQGRISQSQSDYLTENRGVCSAVAGGGLYREDGKEIRRRRIEDIGTEQEIVVPDRVVEGDCVGKQRDSQRTTSLDKRAEQRLEERIQDIGTVQSERKLGTASGQREDVNSKLQPKKNNASGVPGSNDCVCEEAENAVISQKKELKSENTKEDCGGMGIQAGDCGGMGIQAREMEQSPEEDDFILLD